MLPIHLILLVLSFVLVLVASFGVNPPKVQLAWLGVALFILSFFFTGV